MKSFLKFLILAVLGFFLGAGLAVLQRHFQPTYKPHKAAEAGKVQSVPDPNAKEHIGGPFSLVDQTGRAVTEKSWPQRNAAGINAGAGQPVPQRYKLVYFGYTHCKDTCPATLQKIAGIMQKLGPAAEKIVPLFITVDPERDTVKVMARYLQRFHSRYLVGLTGTKEQIAAVEKAYHVYVAQKAAQSAADYAESLESHSAYVYLMSPADKLVTVFDSDATAQDMLVKLQKYVK